MNNGHNSATGGEKNVVASISGTMKRSCTKTKDQTSHGLTGQKTENKVGWRKKTLLGFGRCVGLEVVTTATYTKALFHVEAIIYSTAREFHKQFYWKKISS